ncbi:glycosyltransferase [Vibrio cyclitrophicus]
MNILMVSGIDLSEKNKAGNVNAFRSLVAGMKREGFNLTLLNVNRTKVSKDNFSGKVIYFPLLLNLFELKLRKFLKIEKNLVNARGSLFLKFFVYILERFFKYDYIVVEYLEFHSSIDLIDKNKRICDLHDLMHLRTESYFSQGKYLSKISQISRSEELELINKFSKVLVIQEVEHDFLKKQKLTSEAILVKRHSIDADNQSIVNKRFCRDEIVLGFIGNTSDFNIDGINYFIENYYPLLRKEWPALRLFIAGRVCEKIRIELLTENEGIVLLGLVGDLKDFYEKIDIVINPIRVGFGLKTKNVEALAFGLPVITTKCGIEGLEAFERKVIFEYRDPVTAINAVKAVINLFDKKIDIKLIYEREFGLNKTYLKLVESLKFGK